MNKKLFCAVAGALLLTGTAIQAAEPDQGQWSLSAGFDYSSGKYGLDTSTDIWSVPLIVGYTADRWTFKVIVPYINVSGSSNVIPGIGRVYNRNPISRGRARGRGLGAGAGTGTLVTGTGTIVTTGSASGIGDVIASAGYEIVQSADHSFGMDLSGQIKFGTADADKGLGTGKNDYGVSLDVHKSYENWTTFGGAGWTKYSSSPYIQLKNGFNATVGAGYKVGEQDNIGAYYYYRQKIAVGGGPMSELTAYWNHKLGNAMRLQFYVLGGFADGSPDYGGGASLKYMF